MIGNKNLFLGILIICAIAIIGVVLFVLNKPAPVTLPTGEKAEGQDCRSDIECKSGVCNFIKQDWGQCAAVICITGSQAQGISDISFFCSQNNKWQKIKNLGKKCNYDYECFRHTCKDSPGCHFEDYKYSCKNNACVEEKQQNACEKQGLKRITSKSDADSNGDGSCFPSMAQREEITVCAPCGNGVCDTELESKCNCPVDCK